MNDPIPEPLSGKHVLDWAVPVTRALNAIGDKIGAPARNERDRRPSRQPLPFEVRWDGSLNNSSGGWKIYLPTEHLLTYGGVDVATSDISGATVIQDDDNNDTPWFSLDDIDTEADHVWLVVTVTESNGSVVSVDAEFAAEEGQAATGENVVNICIAEVSYEEPENEGDPAVVTIKQSVVGALHLGGAGGGGGSGGSSATGVNGTIYSFEGLYWDSSSYKVRAKFRPCTVTNGLITAIGSEELTADAKSISTTPITSEVPY